MLCYLSKTVKIKLGISNKKYYRSLGYDISLSIIEVNVNELLPTTRVDIIAICDVCKSEVITSYKNYKYNSSNFDMYTCSALCTSEKIKKSNLIKYGVEYANQSIIIKNKTFENSIKNIKRQVFKNIEITDYLKYLKTREVILTINKWNIEHLSKLGYDNLKQNEKWYIPVQHLMKNSSAKIECICDCSSIKTISFQKFTQNYNRSNTYNCKSCNNITYKKSMTEKYGNDNPSNIESCIEKRKETCREKYASEYVVSSDYSKQKTKQIFDEKYGGHPSRDKEIMNKIISKGKITKIKNGHMIPDDKLSDWELYRRNVRRITEQNRNTLLEKWDGLDYYDNEYIKDNFNLKHTDINYPTLDHKISIIYGFKNDIDPVEIASLENICMTKKTNNSSKSFLTESEYKEKTQS